MSYMDFFFLLEPTDGVKNSIAYFKNFAGDIVGRYPGMKATAHLSLHTKTRQKPYEMKAFLSKIRPKIMSLTAIELQIDGFKSFKHAEEKMTIYANIRNNYKADYWIETIRREINGPALIPHLTITKNIPADSYIKLWPYFKYKPYLDKFMPEHLTVLARESYKPDAKWEIFDKIPFRKPPVNTSMVA